MASIKVLGRKTSGKSDKDHGMREDAYRPPSRSNSKSGSRAFSLPRIISQASRGLSAQMQFQTRTNLDASDRRGYDELSRISLPEFNHDQFEENSTFTDENSVTRESIHVQRAAACCLASYFDFHEAKHLFDVYEIERLNFKEVYLSPLPEQEEEEETRQNILIATAVDNGKMTVYVAFRGNSNLAEVFSDVCPPSEIKVFQESPPLCGFREDMGSYHKNFCNRLGQLVPRVDGLLEFCRSLVENSTGRENSADFQISPTDAAAAVEEARAPRPRLVFCGHSFGGALSHLVTAAYLLSIFRDTTDVLKHQSEEPMSITFGAPLVFDQRAANFLDQIIPVHRRFLNFFQAKDPIPFILAQAPISHQSQELFEQLKTKHAVSLTVTGRFLVDRKLSKFLKNPQVLETRSVLGERDHSSSKREKTKKSKKGHARSLSLTSPIPFQLESTFLASPSSQGEIRRLSLPMSESSECGSQDSAIVTRKNVRLPLTNTHGIKMSNLNKKVSEGFQSVADAGKEFIRKVAFRGKKAIDKVNSNLGGKRQLSSLQSDVKKARVELTDEDSATSFFTLFGVYKRLSFDGKARSHTIKELKPEDIVHRNFNLKKNHIKQHKIASYFYCLVGDHYRGSAVKSKQQNEVRIREGPLPRLDKAELILIRCETSEKLKGARIIATGKHLSLALEHLCQVTTFSDKWRLVTADSSSIIFETLRATDCKNVYVSQGELIELARVGHGNRVTTISVETIFGRNSGEFFPVLLRDLAADSAVIDGLKHSVGKILILFDSDGPKGGEAGRKILHHLQKAAKLTGLKESYDVIIQPSKGTVHSKKMMIDKGFIAQMCYALCYKPITLVFESHGAEVIEKAAEVVRRQPFTFFMNDGSNGEPAIEPFIKSLNLRTTPITRNSEGLLTIELDSYDHILSCLHALLLPAKHALTFNQRTSSQEYANVIRTCEEDLYEAISGFYEDQMLRKDRLMENWFPGLDEKSRDCLSRRLELLYLLTSAFKVAKEQKLLALIGPENVGKRTLANLLGCKSKESTGYTIHAADMKSYRLAPDLLALDFPSTDAPGARSSVSTIWETFARLPDRCIIMTPFSGDVPEWSQELPRIAAQKLCSDVMLLVNRVDGILKGPAKAKVWKQYNDETIKDLQQKYMHVNEIGGVNLKEVILCSLEEEELHDSDIALLKDRGIIFSKEVKRRILEWIRGPNAPPLPAVDPATRPAVFIETYSRLQEPARRYVGPNFNGDSSSVDDGTSSTKSDPESRTLPKMTRRREEFLAKQNKLKQGGQTNVDVKGSVVSTKIPSTSKLEVSSLESSKFSSISKSTASLENGAKSSSSHKPSKSSSSESSQNPGAFQVMTSPGPAADHGKSSLSSPEPAVSAPESSRSCSNTPIVDSKISSSPKLQLTSDSSKFPDYGHDEENGFSWESSNGAIFSDSEFPSPRRSLFQRFNQQTDNPISSRQHNEDQGGQLSVPGSSEDKMRNGDHRGMDQWHSGDTEDSKGQATPTTSNPSTSPLTGASKSSRGHSQSQFAHQVTQRAVMSTADHSVSESDAVSSKTHKDPASKPRHVNRKSSGSAPWKP
ncbi:hypothetical protein R1flu_005089 [Riccia fluitans]|uniref:Fungal lipase-type domain-containing protein n=1 Tax=Riccia fluitans TaxID=41844 RepID=A0ABD1YSY6_9MARC